MQIMVRSSPLLVVQIQPAQHTTQQSLVPVIPHPVTYLEVVDRDPAAAR